MTSNYRGREDDSRIIKNGHGSLGAVSSRPEHARALKSEDRRSCSDAHQRRDGASCVSDPAAG